MQLQPSKISASRPSAFCISHSAFIRRRGFTLIELVVVIVIMLILMSITLPAIRSMMRDNNQTQAVNLLTSMIANAHAIAMRTHTPAGLVIYEDPKLPNQSSVQLVVQSGLVTGSPLVRYFTYAPNTGPEQLPMGINVGTLDDSTVNGGIRTQVASSTNTMCRCIVFDGNGQLVLVNGLSEDQSLVTSNDPAAKAWNLNATTGDASGGVSAPGFIVYSAADFKATGITDPTAAATWVKQNADLFIVNAYTGNVIRYAK